MYTINLTEEQLNAQLCYVSGNIAYFTTQNLQDQWGDDWEDSPYEHNAGIPYYPRNGEQYQIITVCFTGSFDQPCDVSKIYLSVEQINQGVVPWLCTDKWARESKSIFAGTILKDFISIIWQVDGDVYLPLSKENR